ncbi:efflux RND transporter periplasmic adaptor subunit [Paraneptunicella aestuarii]|uniref:efflux RND transporter periplasmic adaptor subunit n=1 Tax=Paraneptunicella aestuarii TaxID=2831148 RepID=UPI001E527C22|nr:efflux RND transporter periplasmic adaptor subunit [Paraneptunicella aestuarii]UAA39046.1 efflux RND transporter periplasmic adaptor subunit [Paraneptunicella aestuarii]
MNKWIALVGVVIVIALVWFLNLSDPIQVSTAKVEQGTVAETVANTRSGSVKACRRSNLSLPLGGQISQINVTEGDRVTTGQLLLQLSNDDIKASIEQANALITAAKLEQQRYCVIADSDKHEYERVRKLVAQKLSTEEQIDLAEAKYRASAASCAASQAQVEQSLANLKMQEATLAKSTLYAPFDGIVAEVNGEVGEFATPSPPGIATLPLIDLINADCFYISAPMDEVDAGRLQVGQTVKVTIDAYRDQDFPGTVRRIAPYVYALEKQARTVEVEANITNSEAFPLLVGYSADMEVIISQQENTLRVPTEAVFDENKVYVVNNGTLQLKTIEAGLSNWRYTEVKSGLKQGDQVVTSTTQSGLVDGIKVVIQ